MFCSCSRAAATPTTSFRAPGPIPWKSAAAVAICRMAGRSGPCAARLPLPTRPSRRAGPSARVIAHDRPSPSTHRRKPRRSLRVSPGVARPRAYGRRALPPATKRSRTASHAVIPAGGRNINQLARAIVTGLSPRLIFNCPRPSAQDSRLRLTDLFLLGQEIPAPLRPIQNWRRNRTSF